MKWLENNPTGLVLAGCCALFLLITAGLGFLWSRPASSGDASADVETGLAWSAGSLTHELGPESDYEEVVNRPLFVDSRRPQISVEEEEPEEVTGVEVANAPDVKVSSIVITPEMRIVNIRPADGGETLMIRQDQDLGEQYSGWSVSSIEPRRVKLQSSRGESFDLELEVNTRRITEPPKMEPEMADANEGAGGGEDGESGEQLSRAEEIRRRIAERREELRRQAEEDKSEESEPKVSRYQEAIRNMMGNRNNQNDEDESDDDGSNG